MQASRGVMAGLAIGVPASNRGPPGSWRGLLEIAGAAFRSLGDSWADTSTPHGRLMIIVLGGLAEFERELIRARVGEGQARAKAQGHMGRPPKLTPHQRREALPALADDTASQAEQARRFNVSKSTISRLAASAAPIAALPTQLHIDETTERTARAFMQRLESRYPRKEAILYGSRAAAPIA